MRVRVSPYPPSFFPDVNVWLVETLSDSQMLPGPDGKAGGFQPPNSGFDSHRALHARVM